MFTTRSVNRNSNDPQKDERIRSEQDALITEKNVPIR